MRLAAQAKGGYYPTPERVVDLIAELIHTPTGYYHRGRETIRILEPLLRGRGRAGEAGRAPGQAQRPRIAYGAGSVHRDLRRGAAPGQGARRPRSGSTAPWPRTCSPRR